jgi:hypothetical protein
MALTLVILRKWFHSITTDRLFTTSSFFHWRLVQGSLFRKLQRSKFPNAPLLRAALMP